MPLRVFTCTDHEGHWPVGVASVIVAADEAGAMALLIAELLKHGLKPNPRAAATLTEISTEAPCAYVLADGDY